MFQIMLFIFISCPPDLPQDPEIAQDGSSEQDPGEAGCQEGCLASEGFCRPPEAQLCQRAAQLQMPALPTVDDAAGGGR